MTSAIARQWQRVDYQVPVQLLVHVGKKPGEDASLVASPRTLLAHAVNVSEGGISVRVHDPLPLGEAVTCSMLLEGKQATLPGRVRWVKSTTEGLAEGAGIQFDSLRDDESGLLRHLVQRATGGDQPVDIYFPSLKEPVRARALTTDGGLYITASLPVLTRDTEVEFQFAGEGPRFLGRVARVAVRERERTPQLEVELAIHAREMPRFRRYTMYGDPTREAIESAALREQAQAMRELRELRVRKEQEASLRESLVPSLRADSDSSQAAEGMLGGATASEIEPSTSGEALAANTANTASTTVVESSTSSATATPEMTADTAHSDTRSKDGGAAIGEGAITATASTASSPAPALRLWNPAESPELPSPIRHESHESHESHDSHRSHAGRDTDGTEEPELVPRQSVAFISRLPRGVLWMLLGLGSLLPFAAVAWLAFSPTEPAATTQEKERAPRAATVASDDRPRMPVAVALPPAAQAEPASTATPQAVERAPEVRVEANETEISIPIQGTLEGARSTLWVTPAAVVVTLPNARFDVPARTYSVKAGGVSRLTLLHDGHASVLRVFVAAGPVHHALQLHGDVLSLRLQRDAATTAGDVQPKRTKASEIKERLIGSSGQ